MLKFWKPVFRRRLPFSLRKNTHGKFAEEFGKKIGGCFFVFRCVFRSVFCFSLATPYFEHIFKLLNRKISRGIRSARISLNNTLAFLARTPTRKRFPHSTVYECLTAFFGHACVSKTHRHAVYPCLKKPPIFFFRHASVF